MATTSIILGNPFTPFVSTSYLVGNINSTSNYSIPDTASTIFISLTRVLWPKTGSDVISINVAYSTDFGNTWVTFASFTAKGEDVVDPSTSLAATASSINVPIPAGTSRQLRFSMNVSAALTTAMTSTVN